MTVVVGGRVVACVEVPVVVFAVEVDDVVDACVVGAVDAVDDVVVPWWRFVVAAPAGGVVGFELVCVSAIASASPPVTRRISTATARAVVSGRRRRAGTGAAA